MDPDPDTLLEWLQAGVGEERDLQLMALEQLCMLLLMSDNIDKCFETCPPRSFLPALGRIFLDETAPENILEVAARAITYYLDVSNECTRRVTQVDGVLRAISSHLHRTRITDRISRDLAEQCVKLLEHVCQREASAVYAAGGLEAILDFICHKDIHKDTMYSAMSLVSRLCTKVETKDENLPKYSSELCALFHNDDEKIVETALRSFATLVDRFIAKRVDLTQLMTDELVDDLLDFLNPHNSLLNATLESLPNQSLSSIMLDPDESNVSNLSYNRRPTVSATFASIIVPLLYNLCKGSSSLTEQFICSSKLFAALSGVISSHDDQCASYGIRLVELLVILITEGRDAMCKTYTMKLCTSGGDTSDQGAFNRTQRHLIDLIRHRDTDTLIDIIESEEIDPNFVDDVGQTLLNWASSFGNIEMVSYLCEKGADPNKGQRSSSLHYAASFGRAEIVKILLDHGADVFLRDEEGRTPLDRAKDRTDGDQNVCKVLMDALDKDDTHANIQGKETPQTPIKRSQNAEQIFVADMNTKLHNIDHEFLQIAIQRIIIILCTTFQNNRNSQSRRTIILLIKKCILFLPSSYWQTSPAENSEIFTGINCNEEILELVDRLMGVINFVLDDSNIENKEHVLLIMKSLLEKNADFWAQHVIRLGLCEKIEFLANQKNVGWDNEVPIISKVSEVNQVVPTASASSLLIDDSTNTDNSNKSNVESVSKTPLKACSNVSKKTDNSSDVWRIIQGSIYKWRDWRLVRSRDSTFLWCDAVALEFCDGSNGWIRYLLDGTLHTMYSSGTPESGGDGDSRIEFITKFQKSKAEAGESNTKTIFSLPKTARKIELGNWRIGSSELGVLCITNTEGNQQRIIVKNEHPGFVFESGKHQKKTFAAESVLGTDFETGWSASHRLNVKSDGHRVNLCELAKELFKLYLKEAKLKPRESFLELKNCADRIVKSLNNEDVLTSSSITADFTEVLNKLKSLFFDERLLSAHEIIKSNIVPAVLKFLRAGLDDIFLKAFSDPVDFSRFVRKVLLVLESIENFPLYVYDIPNGPYGLQLLTRRLKFRLELNTDKESKDAALIDRTNSSLKCEPLTTVGSLKTYLGQTLVKKWYNYPRSELNFVKSIKALKDQKNHLTLTYNSDFDTNGLIWYLGTNAMSSGTDWINPASVSIVRITSSDGPKQPYGNAENILSRDVTPLNCHTSDSSDASFTIDLGVWILPTEYTLRHSTGYGRSALRNWFFQGSKDCVLWECLVIHSNDQSLNEPGSTATWQIECEKNQGPYRYVRIAQNGKNSSDTTYYLSLSGFEIYGRVIDVVDAELKPLDLNKTVAKPSAIKPSRQTSNAQSVIHNAFTSAKKQIRRNISNSTQHIGTSVQRPPTAVLSRIAQRQQRHDKSFAISEPITKKSQCELKKMPMNISSSHSVSGATKKYRQREAFIKHAETQQEYNTEKIPIDVQNYNINNEPKIPGFMSLNINRIQSTSSESTKTINLSSSESMSEANESDVMSSNANDYMEELLTLSEILEQGHKEPESSRIEDLKNEHAISAGVGTNSNNSLVPRIPPVLVPENQTSEELRFEDAFCQEPSPTEIEYKAATSTLSSKVLKMIEDEVIGDSFAQTSDQTANDKVDDNEQPEDSFEYENSMPSLQIPETDLIILSESDRGRSVSETSHIDLLHGDIINDEFHYSDDNQSQVTNTDKSLSNDANSLHNELVRLEEDADAGSNVAEVSEIEDPSRKRVNILSKLDNYADVLKNMVHQVIGSGDFLKDDDGEDNELENVILEEMILGQELRRRFIETEWDTKFSSSDPCDSSSTSQGGIQSQIDSFVSVASALKRQLSLKLANSSNTGMKDIPFSAIKALAFGSSKDSTKSCHHINNAEGTNYKSVMRKLAVWDDEFCLKRSFESLIPAFDPRPGRQNVNQIQEIEIPNDISSFRNFAPRRNSYKRLQKVRLFLKVTNNGGGKEQKPNIIMELKDDHSSVFSYVQKLSLRLKEISSIDNKPVEIDKERHSIFDPNYTILYSTNSPEEEPDQIGKDIAYNSLVAEELTSSTLELLRLFFSLSNDFHQDKARELFNSQKMTQKLIQQLIDPVASPARALPEWCGTIVYHYPCLFSFETRLMHLRATAFGDERTIMWLQNRRDQIIEQSRSALALASRQNMAGLRREDHYLEFRIGRIKHERIKVHRCEEKIYENAAKILEFHARRKSMLEIEYHGEEGTGLGPTLEFYALVAAEFRRKSKKMWICEDNEPVNGVKMDLGEGAKPPGYYVQRAGGLFPAYIPRESKDCGEASEHFRIFGIFLAKLIQDNRMVDIPLSLSFLKILLSSKVFSSPEIDLSGILTINDLEEIMPLKARFLKSLEPLIKQKRAILSSPCADDEKVLQINALKVNIDGKLCSLDDLALTFVINPPSKIFEYAEAELIENGAEIYVTIDNVEDYYNKALEFYLDLGIRQQIVSFREGFNSVFPLSSLAIFNAEEVQMIISGDQTPQWSREDLLNFTEPRLGYTKESRGFLNFVEVLLEFDTTERKAFLQFATGCSSLPPGGLANLQPRLTIVRKTCEGDNCDGSYPSVNTCLHYLKLPEYTSSEILRKRLLCATLNKGFYLN